MRWRGNRWRVWNPFPWFYWGICLSMHLNRQLYWVMRTGSTWFRSRCRNRTLAAGLNNLFVCIWIKHQLPRRWCWQRHSSLVVARELLPLGGRWCDDCVLCIFVLRVEWQDSTRVKRCRKRVRNSPLSRCQFSLGMISSPYPRFFGKVGAREIVGWLQFFPHMIDYDSMERPDIAAR